MWGRIENLLSIRPPLHLVFAQLLLSIYCTFIIKKNGIKCNTKLKLILVEWGEAVILTVIPTH